MKFSTANGKEWTQSDMCAHCQMSTGGGHEFGCPFFTIPEVEAFMEAVETYLVPITDEYNQAYYHAIKEGIQAWVKSEP